MQLWNVRMAARQARKVSCFVSSLANGQGDLFASSTCERCLWWMTRRCRDLHLLVCHSKAVSNLHLRTNWQSCLFWAWAGKSYRAIQTEIQAWSEFQLQVQKPIPVVLTSAVAGVTASLGAKPLISDDDMVSQYSAVYERAKKHQQPPSLNLV